ncbi:hypothetical protein PoB_003182300 [Plakobranchus ocellatus]|uniref:Reverse transcriptase domain-containing protein n=1 Tax=Plakobranchus ocellatus TaxID=259542 RepID=A0AAV4ADJ7_9GAST|nr:hypothetical protein PoB_003182300 [Plakobranchus ocellatus]
MLYIILERLKAKIENELAEEQSGFRPGRGTSDMLCSIQVIIEKVFQNHVSSLKLKVTRLIAGLATTTVDNYNAPSRMESAK